MKGLKIIVYDNEDITYKEGYLMSVECEPNIIEECSLLDEEPKQRIDGYIETMQCYVGEEKQSIELDPTTMKRILKYNKEIQIKQLDEEINKKAIQLKELDDKLQDREQRWEKVKNYIANIYDMDLNEEDEDDWDWED